MTLALQRPTTGQELDDWQAGRQLNRSYTEDELHELAAEFDPFSATIDVEGEQVLFAGFREDERWIAEACTRDVQIRLTVDRVDLSKIQLSTVTDISPHFENELRRIRPDQED